MSVKNALDDFFKIYLEKYQETTGGLPITTRRKDIDQIIYVGDDDSTGHCRWKPVLYGQEKDFLRLLEDYEIEKNDDIVEYFCSYYYLGIRVMYKKRSIAIRTADVLDGFKRLKRIINAYTDQNGKITYIGIGIDQVLNYSIVVEVKTGIVKYVDDETGKMRKIAPSLEEFIQGWETIVI